MGPYRKVVWNEGMLLTPHHFQQWDNYHEALLNSRFGALAPYPWGVLGLQLNDAAVAKGTCEVLRCRALMPDGLVVDIPQAEAAPPSRPVAEHMGANGADRLGVYLSIPAMRAGAANYQPNGGERRGFVRYWQDAARVKDETTGENEQQLSFARSNLRLMFDGEPRDGYNSIKIAEIRRTPTGTLAYEENYIPPALDVNASPWLARALRELVDILIAKSSSLAEQRGQRATSDVAVFWLLHTVNSFIPGLAHLLRTHPVHPERLYAELATLCGQLMTFVTGRHPQDIVTYEHTDLYGTFSRLFKDLRVLLDIVIPTRCVPIPLQDMENGVHVGRVLDGRLLANAEFYLTVKARLAGGQLIERVQSVVKVASHDIIDAMIQQNVYGLSLTHSASPPQPLPSLPGHYFFILEKEGPYWERIARAQNIAIFVPAELPEPELGLYAVKP